MSTSLKEFENTPAIYSPMLRLSETLSGYSAYYGFSNGPTCKADENISILIDKNTVETVESKYGIVQFLDDLVKAENEVNRVASNKSFYEKNLLKELKKKYNELVGISELDSDITLESSTQSFSEFDEDTVPIKMIGYLTIFSCDERSNDWTPLFENRNVLVPKTVFSGKLTDQEYKKILEKLDLSIDSIEETSETQVVGLGGEGMSFVYLTREELDPTTINFE